MTPGASPLLLEGEHHWPPGMDRRWDRRAYDAGVSWLAARSLPATIMALDVLGRSANIAGAHPPSIAEIAALYTWLPRSQCRLIAPRIAALRLKNRAAVALAARGRIAELAHRVRWAAEGPPRLAGPGGRILTACHVGVFFGISAALERARIRAFMLRDAPMRDPAARAAAFKEAVDTIRRGGTVVAIVDGPGGSSTGDVECLGRRVVFRRGPFALARLTRAPLVPVVGAWTQGGAIEMRAGPDIEPAAACSSCGPDDVETGLAASVARWLESYLRAEPQEIWPSTIRNFLAAPPAR